MKIINRFAEADRLEAGGLSPIGGKSMDVCLDLNGITITWNVEDVADSIILLTQGKLAAGELENWLRALAGV